MSVVNGAMAIVSINQTKGNLNEKQVDEIESLLYEIESMLSNQTCVSECISMFEDRYRSNIVLK